MYKRLIKVAVSIIMLQMLLVSQLSAEVFWTAPLKLENVSAFYWDANKNNYIVLTSTAVIKMENGANIPSGCALTDTKNQVTMWSETSLSNTLNAWLSIALNARNLGEKVQLLLNSSSCSSIGGMKLRGIQTVQ